MVRWAVATTVVTGRGSIDMGADAEEVICGGDLLFTALDHGRGELIDALVDDGAAVAEIHRRCEARQLGDELLLVGHRSGCRDRIHHGCSCWRCCRRLLAPSCLLRMARLRV